MSLEIKNLNKSFFSKEKDSSFNLRVNNLKLDTGSVNVLLGPNGAGKSTLFKSILQLQNSKSEKTKILGLDSFNSCSRESVAYLPEYYSFDSELIVDTFLDTYMLINNKNIKDSKNSLLKDFSIDFISKKIKHLSKGMLQRLIIAYTISPSNKKLFFLDEPYTALDFNQRNNLNEYIKALVINQKKTFFISTHDIDTIESIYDNVYILDKGEFIFSGNRNTIENEYSTLGMLYSRLIK